VFAYASSDGGRSNGSVRVDGNRFEFAPHTHRSRDGTEQRLRSIWTLEPSGRLVMTSERQEEGAWRPFARIIYTRAQDIRPPS
jgi:hypothetical protein